MEPYTLRSTHLCECTTADLTLKELGLSFQAADYQECVTEARTDTRGNVFECQSCCLINETYCRSKGGMFKLLAKRGQDQLACSEAYCETTSQCSLSINKPAVRLRQAIHQHICYAQVSLCNIRHVVCTAVRSSHYCPTSWPRCPHFGRLRMRCWGWVECA